MAPKKHESLRVVFLEWPEVEVLEIQKFANSRGQNLGDFMRSAVRAAVKTPG